MAYNPLITNSTNFTLIELDRYFDLYQSYKTFDNNVNFWQYLTCLVSGLIGLICHIITLFSLSHLPFTGCTDIYYRSMTVMEIIHMLIMTQYGALWLFAEKSFQTNFSLAVWSCRTFSGWHFGDTLKPAISTLTTFISFERMVAVCIPTCLEVVKKRTIAYGAILVSLTFGSPQLFSIFARQIQYDKNLKLYLPIDTDFSNSTLHSSSLTFIYAVKVGLSLAIFVFSMVMIVGLRNEGKKMAKWTGAVKSDWLAKRRLCMFSFILAGCVLLDHASWVSYKTLVHGPSPVVGESAVTRVGATAQSAMSDLKWARVTSAFNIIQTMTGQLVHCYRFFIHFAFNKAMRDAVRKLMKMKTNHVGQVGIQQGRTGQTGRNTTAVKHC